MRDQQNAKKEITKPEASSISETYGPSFRDADLSLLTGSSFSFFIVNAILVGFFRSTSQVAVYFEGQTPEVIKSIRDIIDCMERNEIISVRDGQFTLLKTFSFFSLSGPGKNDPIKNVFQSMVERLIGKFEEKDIQKGDTIRWFTLPDRADVRDRITELNQKYVGEVVKIIRESNANGSSDITGLRVLGLMTTQLQAEELLK